MFFLSLKYSTKWAECPTYQRYQFCGKLSIRDLRLGRVLCHCRYAFCYSERHWERTDPVYSSRLTWNVNFRLPRRSPIITISLSSVSVRLIDSWLWNSILHFQSTHSMISKLMSQIIGVCTHRYRWLWKHFLSICQIFVRYFVITRRESVDQLYYSQLSPLRCIIILHIFG